MFGSCPAARGQSFHVSFRCPLYGFFLSVCPSLVFFVASILSQFEFRMLDLYEVFRITFIIQWINIPFTCSWEELLHPWSSLLSNTKLACIPPLELHPRERGRWNQTEEGTLKPPLLSIILENIRSLPKKMELFAWQMAGGESPHRGTHNHRDRNLARRGHFKQ